LRSRRDEHHRLADERFVDGAIEPKDVFSYPLAKAKENVEGLPTAQLAPPTVGSMKASKTV
jgi:hypothetical protein